MAEYDGEIRIKATIDSEGEEKDILKLLDRLKKSTRDYRETLESVNKVNLNTQKFDNANKSINNQIEQTKRLNTFQEDSARLLRRKNNYYIRQEKNLNRIIDKEAEINRLQNLRNRFEAGEAVTPIQKELKPTLDIFNNMSRDAKLLNKDNIAKFNSVMEEFNKIATENIGKINWRIRKLAVDIEYAKNRYKEFGNYISQYSKKIANLPIEEREKQAREKLRIAREEANEQIRIAKERDQQIKENEEKRKIRLEYLNNAFEKIGNIARGTSKILMNTFFTPFQLGFKALISPIKIVTSLISNFFNRALRLAGLTIIFQTLRSGFRVLREYLFGALRTNSQFVQSLNQIRSNLLTAFYPIYQAILPALNLLMQGLSKATSYLAQFISMLFGKSISSSQRGAGQLNNQIIALGQSSKGVRDNTSAVDDNANSYDELGNSIKKDNKQLAAFDKSIHNSKKEIAAFDKLILFNQEKEKKKKPKKVPKIGGAGEAFIPTTNFDSTYKNMETIFDSIRSKIQPTIEALKEFGQSFNDTVVPFAKQAAKDFYEDFFRPLAEDFVTKGAPRFLKITSNMLKNIEWEKINKSLDNLWKSLKPFAEHLGDGLLWFHENVLVPLGEWTMNEFVPTFLDLLSSGVTALDKALKSAKPVFQWFYDDFLKPVGEFAGNNIINNIKDLTDKLNGFSEDGRKAQSTGEELAKTFIAIASGLAAVAAIKIGMSMFAWVTTLATALNPVSLALAGIGISVGLLTKALIDAKYEEEATKKATQNFFEDIGMSQEEFNKKSIQEQNNIIKNWEENQQTITDEAKKARYEFTKNHITLLKQTKERELRESEDREKAYDMSEEIILGIKKRKWDEAFKYAKEHHENLAKIREENSKKIVENFSRMISNIQERLGTWWGWIRTFFSQVGTTIGEAFQSSLTSLISKAINWVQDRINYFVDKINNMIDLIRKLPGTDWIQRIPKVDIPGLIRSSGHFPRLAQGAVLKGGNPMIAYLNDQPKGQVNIETPLNTMVDAFRKAMNDRNGVSPNITIEAQGELGSIVKMLNLKLKQENARVGTSLVSGDVWY